LVKKFGGILGKELQPNRRFGTELSDYVKARTGLSGIIHSDELPSYGISEKEVNDIKETLQCKKEDAFVFVVGEITEAKKAIKVVLDRCKVALQSVPQETRNALVGGNTQYSRLLSGSSRMYPETDLKAIFVPETKVKELKKDLPLSVEERYKLYTKWGLSEKITNQMKLNNMAPFFEKLVKKKFEPKIVSVVLLDDLTQIKRMGADPKKLSEKLLEEFFSLRKKGTITREISIEVLFELAKNPQKNITQILKEKAVDTVAESEVEKTIKEIIENNMSLIKEKKELAFSALMGEAMKQLKGNASGEQVSAILRKELKKVA